MAIIANRIADDMDRTRLCLSRPGAVTAFKDNAGVIGAIRSIEVR